jgi:multiple sugar transport system substrate-binding protein
MREVHESWWQRVAHLIATFAIVVAVTPIALAQPVEIAYNTFLDPNNASDPRATAQTKMIAEFERQNPNIKVRVVVDPTGANGARSA